MTPTPTLTLTLTLPSPGAVSLYGSRSILSSATPKATHEVLNLRHPISTLAFNPQSELLTFASKYDKAALRVMHVSGGEP